MIVQDTISGLTITVGDKGTPRHCTISMKDKSDEKIELWVQDWPTIKEAIDRMFNIANHIENNRPG